MWRGMGGKREGERGRERRVKAWGLAPLARGEEDAPDSMHDYDLCQLYVSEFELLLIVLPQFFDQNLSSKLYIFHLSAIFYDAVITSATYLKTPSK